MSAPMQIVILGLSLSSSWGNGHATTYRSLISGLASWGCKVQFLERDVPWYAEHRDVGNPSYCALDYYHGLDDLQRRFGGAISRADMVLVGSYVPDGAAVIDWLARHRPRAFCFYDIDTPVTLAKLDRGDEEYLGRRQISLFDVYFSFSGGRILQRLETRYKARRARALYCSVDETVYRSTRESPRWDFGYLGTYSPDRQPILERLLLEPARRLPDMRFVVAGSMFPADIAWPANVERIDHLPPARHASFYSSQRFTLNVTRADMVAAGWSPSVRLFEAAAIGTPIISDNWPGLGEILPEGEAILVAHDSNDVVRFLAGTSDNERRCIGDAARARVHAAHTGRARAGELLAELQRLRSESSSTRLEAV